MGPSSEEEAAFLAQERENGAIVVPVNAAPAEEPQGDLPAMDELVKRIPMPTRDLLEELFRARFVTVRRMPRAALK